MTPSFRLLCSIAAETHQAMRHCDIKRAFLHSEKTNPQVVQVLIPPPGVEEKGVLWMATHVLYGLREAPRAFHNTMKPVLLGFGLRQVPGDQCLWYGDFDGKPVYIVLQVDDFLVCSSEEW